MYKRGFFFFFLFISVCVKAQQTSDLASPHINDFEGLMQQLASDKMEGRETATKGGYLAGDFIAEYMLHLGLSPVADLKEVTNEQSTSAYFQGFELWRNTTQHAAISFGNNKNASIATHKLNFEVLSCPVSDEVTGELSFGGYGLINSDSTYNDFSKGDFKGKIVIMFDGFPGQADTNEIVWKKFGREFRNKGADLAQKRRNALNYGAKAVLMVNPQLPGASGGKVFRNWVSNITGMDASSYPDHDYLFPSDTSRACIPVFFPDELLTQELTDFTGLDMSKTERHYAINAENRPVLLPAKTIKLSTKVLNESIIARNIIGMIKGVDSSKSIVIGGHYDHLGRRGDSIYNGADDNASGASGVLALAKKWKESGMIPQQNILFACWDAEEKGLLGSTAFVNKLKGKTKDIRLYINMDMISRSAEEDSLQRILSVGMRSQDSSLLALVLMSNSSLKPSFELDIWNVNGHSGSDYAAFAEAGVPLMTFFSGFHKDYHSPRDRMEKVDLEKMRDVLQLVNRCLTHFSE